MNTSSQFVRFAAIGLLSNFVLYVLYLFATLAGVGHKTAMTVLYMLGVITTFVFNRNWSFGHNGVVSSALLRYLFSYLVGYVVNWFALYFLVDRTGWPHQWVQGAMIVLLAIGMFVSQKYWVFTDEATQ